MAARLEIISEERQQLSFWIRLLQTVFLRVLVCRTVIFLETVVPSGELSRGSLVCLQTSALDSQVPAVGGAEHPDCCWHMDSTCRLGGCGVPSCFLSGSAPQEPVHFLSPEAPLITRA